jgi:hypothetical protein
VTPTDAIDTARRAAGLARERIVLLGAGIGASAVLIALLAYLPQLLPEPGGSAPLDLPVRLVAALVVMLTWATFCAVVALPMAVALGALTSSERTVGALVPRAAALLPATAGRLMLATVLPLLALMWVVDSTIAAFSSALEQATSGANSGLEAAAGVPLSYRLVQPFIEHEALRYALFGAIITAWCIWVAHRAVEDDSGVGNPLGIVAGVLPLAAVLAVVSTIALGPMQGRIVGAMFGEIGGPLTQAASESSTAGASLAMLLTGLVYASLVTVVALLWVALLGGDDLLDGGWHNAPTLPPEEPDQPALRDGSAAAAAGADDTALTATLAEAAAAPALATATPAATTPPIASSAGHAVSSLALAPGAPGGTWWWLVAGSVVTLRAHAPCGTDVTPGACDAAGTWNAGVVTIAHGCSRLTAPTDGWYLLGAWHNAPETLTATLELWLPATAVAATDAA